MGDHFWPAVYPGLAIGLLYGLHAGGIFNVLLGSVGGTLAAVAAFVWLPAFFSQDGIVPLAALLATSLLGAYCLIEAIRRVHRRVAPPDN